MRNEIKTFPINNQRTLRKTVPAENQRSLKWIGIGLMHGVLSKIDGCPVYRHTFSLPFALRTLLFSVYLSSLYCRFCAVNKPGINCVKWIGCSTNFYAGNGSPEGKPLTYTSCKHRLSPKKEKKIRPKTNN